jgi:hypothetical protein
MRFGLIWRGRGGDGRGRGDRGLSVLVGVLVGVWGSALRAGVECGLYSRGW